MDKLRPEDLLARGLPQGRSAFRAQVCTQARPAGGRRPDVTLYFEDGSPYEHQIQEMLRAERVYESRRSPRLSACNH
jgi:hypothetical protein